MLRDGLRAYFHLPHIFSEVSRSVCYNKVSRREVIGKKKRSDNIPHIFSEESQSTWYNEDRKGGEAYVGQDFQGCRQDRLSGDHRAAVSQVKCFPLNYERG